MKHWLFISSWHHKEVWKKFKLIFSLRPGWKWKSKLFKIDVRKGLSFSRYTLLITCCGKMVYWLGRSIPNPGIPVSKPLGGARLTQLLILSRSIKWVPRNPVDLAVKSTRSPRNGSVAVRQLNAIHKKGL